MPDKFPPKRLVNPNMVLLLEKVVIAAKIFGVVLPGSADISTPGGKERMVGCVSFKSQTDAALHLEAGILGANECRVLRCSRVQVLILASSHM